MNEAAEPSAFARVWARLLVAMQLVVLGPLTVASTLLSSLLCCCCISLHLKYRGPPGPTDSKTPIVSFFGNCMSGWGMFWMGVLFFLPLLLVVAAGVVAALFVYYPVYVCERCVT
jgi:hypothetical protein